MGAYIILIALIYITYFITRISLKSKEKSNLIFLVVSFIAIYLLCVLRDYSVGRDLSGYIEAYENIGAYSFLDKSWTHMEVGYVAFMQICSFIGFSPRIFLCIVYFIMLYPIYVTIRQYSFDPLLSVIIFICFQFFTFYLSGIRQGLAISICMVSIRYANYRNLKDFLIWSSLFILALVLHRSSLIFILVPIIIRLKLNLINIFMFILSFVFAPTLTKLVMKFNNDNMLSNYTFDDRLVMGGMLVFLFAILLFIIYTSVQCKQYIPSKDSNRINLPQYVFLLAVGVVFALAFNGTMLSRSMMYYTIFIVLAIPNAIKHYDDSFQILLKCAFHIIMIVFFYLFCLVPKALDTVPYSLGIGMLF